MMLPLKTRTTATNPPVHSRPPAVPAAESRWEREFVDAAQGRGVRIVPLSLFYSKSAAAERGPVRRFLVSYGGIELDSVEPAVAALEYAVRVADEATR